MKLQKLFSELDASKEFIELCGPTPQGYKILVDENISLAKVPRVSNITNPIIINPYGENPQKFTIDFVASMQKIPLGNDSTSLILVSYAPLYGTGYNKLPHAMRPITKRLLKKLSDSAYKSRTLAKYFNLRAAMYAEARRILVPGGLLVQVGIRQIDIDYAKKLGFTTVVTPTINNDETCILQSS